MSARFLTQCRSGEPLGPQFNPAIFVPDGKLHIVQPPAASFPLESPTQFFNRMHYRPASMADLCHVVRENGLRRLGSGDVPLACLGWVLVHPITGVRRIPYLFSPDDPLNFQDWRLRLEGRPFGPHWRFAVWQRPVGYCDVDPGD